LASYLGVTASISNISGNTITLSTISATNPFASAPFAYISNAGGITSQVVVLSAPGGSSGAWTLTVLLQNGGTLSGYTGGGTLNAGVAIFRAAGYLGPLMIDCAGNGQDPYCIFNYAAQIQASDTQKNCVFSYHSYGNTIYYQSLVHSVTTGPSTTVITLNSNLPYHPFSLGTTSGGFMGINQFTFTGAQVMTQLNGTFGSPTNYYGSQGAWQLHLNVNSTAWTTPYTANSATVTAYSTDVSGAGEWDYRALYAAFAALRSSGVCVVLGEFGSSNQSGTENTPQSWGGNVQKIAIGQVISGAEANGLGWIHWSYDDHGGNNLFNQAWFSETQQGGANSGQYLNEAQLTATGLNIINNPRTGLRALAQEPTTFTAGPTPNFYISPTGNDANSGTLAAPWTINSLSPWSTGSALSNYNTKIAGKVIGLLPGTYGVSALMQAAWTAFGNATNGIALDVPGGTQANPTQIVSVNSSGVYTPRTATIQANDNGFFGGSNSIAPSMIGQSSKCSARGWVTFDGLVLSGASVFCMTLGDIAGTNTAIANGYVVQNCIFTGNSAQNSTVASGKNVACLTIMTARGAVITNNWFHDNQGWTDGEHFSAIYQWGLGVGTAGTQITFNTFKNSAGIQLKEDTQYDMNVAYNYIDMSVFNPGGQLQNLCPIWGGCEDGNNNGGNTGNNGTLAQFHHNICISWNGTAALSPGNLGSTFISLWYGNGQGYWSYPVACYNNTFVVSSSLNGCGFLASSGGASTQGFVQFYNNGFWTGAFNTVGQYGWFFTNKNAFSLIDYNIYGTTPSSSNWANFSANGSQGLGAISATATSFANWKTLITGATGLDAHSSTNGVNPFSNNGIYALQYQVQSGSPWFNAGRVGGVVAGASTNVGAWDGTSSQIGCNFAT